MSEKDDNYATVRIPKELAEQVDNLIGRMGFRTKAEVVKEAIRNLLNHYEELEKKLPRLEQINFDDNGMKIHDRKLRKVVDVYFKPTGIFCSEDQSDQCEHIDFALSLPMVKNHIRKRRKEGWKLPEV